MTSVAFTGTRRGLTLAQHATLMTVLAELHAPGAQIHLGDCVGADAEAHRIATEIGYFRYGHPGDTGELRANLDYESLAPPTDPLDRNRRMVALGQILVACPGQDHEIQRSGTWATVRYARDRDLPIIFVWPDGHTTTEETA